MNWIRLKNKMGKIEIWQLKGFKDDEESETYY